MDANVQAAVSSFEQVLSTVDSEGLYQKLLIFAFMIPLSVFNSLSSSNTALLLSTPDHHCHVPQRISNEFSPQQWLNITIPWEVGPKGDMKRSSCKMFNISKPSLESEDDDVDNWNNTVIDCRHGWDFDNNSGWTETPVTAFKWVCDRKAVVASLFSLTYSGNAVGTVLFSIISDRYGRKPTFYTVLILNLTCSMALIFAPSLIFFSIFKFLLSLAFYTLYQMPYIIIVELCSEKFRNLVSMTSFIGCIIGTSLVSLAAHFTGHWKWFLLVCHLPSIIFLFSFWFIPESPRWLLSKNRVMESEAVLKRIASFNKREYNEATRGLLIKASEEEQKRIAAKTFFTSFVLLKHLILSCSLLSISYILYAGIILNIHNMTGSKVMNFFILAMVEIPGNVMGSIAARYLGRRLTAFIFFALAALSCIMSTYVVFANEWALATLCALSKMFTGATVLVVYMQIGELFPTTLRATAYGITGVVALAAMGIIPPLIAMGGSNVFLPYYVLSGIGFFGSLLSTFLPETLGQPLPQTLQEAMKVGSSQSYFSVIHSWNVHRYKATQFRNSEYDKSGIKEGVALCHKCKSTGNEDDTENKST